jgi:hypothetical protein
MADSEITAGQASNVIPFPVRHRGRKRRRAKPAKVVQSLPVEEATADTRTAAVIRAQIAGDFYRYLQSLSDTLVRRLEPSLLTTIQAWKDMQKEAEESRGMWP